MKRYLPLIIGLGVVVLLFVLLFSGRSNRPFDDRITLRKDDKIPYGYFAATQLLPKLFPGIPVLQESGAPGNWQQLRADSGGQALVCVARVLEADAEEISGLFNLARAGNHVFIIAADFPEELTNRLQLEPTNLFGTLLPDSLPIRLVGPRFVPRTFSSPGRSFTVPLMPREQARLLVLGTDHHGRANFVQARVGEGFVYLHSAPLAFSNYFLLQPGNDAYLASAFSVLPANIRKLGWSEYFLVSRNRDTRDPNWLGVLMRHEPFRWALLVVLGVLLLYALSEMRRRQRVIRPVDKPQNDSLDFVKTVGRLYFDARDHHNLASKMIQYFLEEVRQQFKLSTAQLDDDFARRLQARSGYPLERIQTILGIIAQVRVNGTTSADTLRQLHDELESFYQST